MAWDVDFDGGKDKDDQHEWAEEQKWKNASDDDDVADDDDHNEDGDEDDEDVDLVASKPQL